MDSRAYAGTDVFDVMRRAMRGSSVRDPSDAIEHKDECDIVRNRLSRLEREIGRLEDGAQDTLRDVEELRRERAGSAARVVLNALTALGGSVVVVLRASRAAKALFRAASRVRSLADIGAAIGAAAVTAFPAIEAGLDVVDVLEDTNEIRKLRNELKFLREQIAAVQRAAEFIEREGRRLNCVL